MAEQIKILVELPDAVFEKLDLFIQQSIEKHWANLNKVPGRLTRSEVAKMIRVTTTTLRNYETSGRLIPQRAGRRVLYNAQEVEAFLKGSSLS